MNEEMIIVKKTASRDFLKPVSPLYGAGGGRYLLFKARSIYECRPVFENNVSDTIPIVRGNNELRALVI
jgi:hypothetical protein